MPAYVRFSRDGVPVRGSVASGPHMGWIGLAAIDVARPAGDSPPLIWLLTRVRTSPSLAMMDGSVRMLRGSLGAGPSGVTAEIDLAGADRDGGELIVLRALVHGVRLVGYAPTARRDAAGNSVVMEKITIAHEGITRAGTSRSSTDITAQLRAQLGAHSFAYVLRRPGLLEMYDYPGAYAQRFDGVDKGGES